MRLRGLVLFWFGAAPEAGRRRDGIGRERTTEPVEVSDKTSRQIAVVFGVVSTVLWCLVAMSAIVSQLEIEWWMAPAGIAVLLFPFAVGFTGVAIIAWIISLRKK